MHDVVASALLRVESSRLTGYLEGMNLTPSRKDAVGDISLCSLGVDWNYAVLVAATVAIRTRPMNGIRICYCTNQKMRRASR